MPSLLLGRVADISQSRVAGQTGIDLAQVVWQLPGPLGECLEGDSVRNVPDDDWYLGPVVLHAPHHGVWLGLTWKVLLPVLLSAVVRGCYPDCETVGVVAVRIFKCYGEFRDGQEGHEHLLSSSLN